MYFIVFHNVLLLYTIRLKEVKMDLTPSDVNLPSPRSRSSLKMRYEAEVEILKRQIGDLEAVRNRLGLSRRKLCQLLMVDPSAWTRWTKDESKVPPHVWKTLQLVCDQGLSRSSTSASLSAEQISENERALRLLKRQIWILYMVNLLLALLLIILSLKF
jgi:hypothetical protein